MRHIFSFINITLTRITWLLVLVTYTIAPSFIQQTKPSAIPARTLHLLLLWSYSYTLVHRRAHNLYFIHPIKSGVNVTLSGGNSPHLLLSGGKYPGGLRKVSLCLYIYLLYLVRVVNTPTPLGSPHPLASHHISHPAISRQTAANAPLLPAGALLQHFVGLTAEHRHPYMHHRYSLLAG